jgi:hypothetical protein
MKEIKLTHNKIALVDDKDFDYLNKFHWKAFLNRGTTTFYAYSKIKGKRIFLHRFLLNPPENILIDHIDGNGLNNQKNNLRFCSASQNRMNVNKISNFKNKPTSSKFKGVVIVNKKYIRCKIGAKYLGYFKTEIDAAKAYDREAKKLYGEFANLNFK